MRNESVTICSELPYGSHERQRLDLYLPAQPVNTEGVLLFIHGGGWHSGDKASHIPDAEYWSARGYLCAIMNYRFVSAQVSIREELDDIAAALQAVKPIGAAHGYALRRVLLSGASAGAQLALMAAYTRAQTLPLKPAAVFCSCPPVDFTAPDFLRGIAAEFEDWKFGLFSDCCGARVTKETVGSAQAQAALRAVSPIRYVAGAVPTAICHGKQDDLIPYAHVLRFVDALEACGVPHDLIPYPASGHELDRDPDAAKAAKARMQQYLDAYL